MSDTIRDIPVEQIVCDQQYNIARDSFTLESLHEFAGSIRDNGLRTPITVRASGRDDKPYMLVCGFRRFHAVAFILKQHTIKAFVKEMTDAEAVMENIIENIDRENLNPIEEARAIRIAFPNQSADTISTKLNRSAAWVGNRLRLLKLPEEIHLMIASGRLKVTDAERINKEESDDEKLKVARAIVKERERGTGSRPSVLRKGKPRNRKEIMQLQVRLINAGLDQLASRVASWCAGYISDNEINADIIAAIEKKNRGS